MARDPVQSTASGRVKRSEAKVHYDAVLVGYRLDGIDGVELITRIRALDHRKDVPIVMVTGTVDVAVVAAALAAGADDVLYKPTDVDILVATVTKYAERSAGKGRRAKHPVRPLRSPARSASRSAASSRSWPSSTRSRRP